MQTPDTPENEDESEDENSGQDSADPVNDEDTNAREEALLEALKALRDLAEKQDEEPSLWSKAMDEAHQCEEAFDWIGMEEAYKRAIDATEDQPVLQAKSLARLASLYSLVDLDVLALETMRAATRAIRKDTFSILICRQLRDEAKLCLKANDLPRAWALINEAFEFVKDGPRHHSAKAFTLVARAQYYIKCGETGDLQKAEADLDSAWKLLKPSIEASASIGWQGGYTPWWEAKAQLHERRQQWWEAIRYRRELVKRLRLSAELPTMKGAYISNEIAKALNDLGKTLRHIGSESASDCFAESRSLRRSIGLAPLDEESPR